MLVTRLVNKDLPETTQYYYLMTWADHCKHWIATEILRIGK